MRVVVQRVGAWLVYAVTLAAVAGGVVIAVQDGRATMGDPQTTWVLAAGAGLLGAFLVTRHPGHRVGWLFLVTALTRGLAGLAELWSIHAYVVRPGSLPFAAFATWVQAAFPLPAFAFAAATVALTPDDRPAGRRERVVLVLAAISLVVLGVAVPAMMWGFRGHDLRPDIPVPDDPVAHAGVALTGAGIAVAVAGVLLGVFGLVARARRSRGDLRQQILWFAYGASVAVALNLAAFLTGLGWLRLFGVVAVLLGIGLGIFRYRLYDVDRLINRTLVYGLVTLAALAVYGAFAVVGGAVVGGRSTVVAAVAAFVVALVLRPLRDLSQGLIDRTFDRRAHSAVRLLRALGERVGHDTVSPDTVVAALRRALRDPTLTVLFRVRATGRLVTAAGDPAPPLDGPVTEVAPRGEPVAVLRHAPVDPALLTAVTRASAVVLEHARLQAELLVHLAEVRASRARLVEAADAERRRVERDLHDGAQQRLVGLALHVQSTRRRLPAVDGSLDALLSFVVDQLDAGVADLRALVNGLHPPALETAGLGAALADLARPGAVEVDTVLDGRSAPLVEATAWFVACEGVANAVKHAPGHPVRVTARLDGALTLSVVDGGPGGADADGPGLRGLRDRVEATGGTLTVASPPGGGTRLTAVLPATVPAAAVSPDSVLPATGRE